MKARATIEKRVGKGAEDQVIRSVRFGPRSGKAVYNPSDVVVLGDSRFLFCDNNTNRALFELRPGVRGRLVRAIVSHPLRGVRPEAIDDMECMTRADVDGETLLFISSSLGLEKKNRKVKKKSRRGKLSAARESLIRARMSHEGRPEAEIIPCFRAWLVENAPELGKSPKRLPDDGGLNVEGLAWDPTQNMLLFGLRTPTKNGRPVILRVRVEDPTGIWNLSNLEMARPVTLGIKGGDYGIRAITYDRSRKVFLVLVGNAVSGKKVPFALYAWDGNTKGIVQRFEGVRFHKKMRPEGLTHGTIGGRGVILFVDDSGGFQFLWDNDPRLRREAATTVRAAARQVGRGRARVTAPARARRAARRGPSAGARARA